jgi:hypothetical protein
VTATLATLSAGLGIATTILALLLRAARREVALLTDVARLRGEDRDAALARVTEIQGRAREERDRYEIALTDVRDDWEACRVEITETILAIPDPDARRRAAHARLERVLSSLPGAVPDGGDGA